MFSSHMMTQNIYIFFFKFIQTLVLTRATSNNSFIQQQKNILSKFLYSNSTLSCTVLRSHAKIGRDLTTHHSNLNYIGSFVGVNLDKLFLLLCYVGKFRKNIVLVLSFGVIGMIKVNWGLGSRPVPGDMKY